MWCPIQNSIPLFCYRMSIKLVKCTVFFEGKNHDLSKIIFWFRELQKMKASKRKNNLMKAVLPYTQGREARVFYRALHSINQTQNPFIKWHVYTSVIASAAQGGREPDFVACTDFQGVHTPTPGGFQAPNMMSLNSELRKML